MDAFLKGESGAFKLKVLIEHFARVILMDMHIDGFYNCSIYWEHQIHQTIRYVWRRDVFFHSETAARAFSDLCGAEIRLNVGRKKKNQKRTC